MGLLEIKHGLLQVAETLDFLHNNAHLAHRAISPEVTIITILLPYNFLCHLVAEKLTWYLISANGSAEYLMSYPLCQQTELYTSVLY
jgi:hypothetical protein